ncbi:MAG: hypothetical protein RLY97_371 [Pseudomonadota bacterium]|jgi:uncharacterized OB-fold protein
MVQKRPDRTLGGPHDVFWDYCAKGQLHIQQCQSCAGFSYPPMKSCEHCGGANMTWQPMSGYGHVVSHCRFEHDYYRGIFAIPHDTIMVELAEGPIMMSNPSGFCNDDLTPNMPVKVAFTACEDSAGVFQLPVFERV